MQIQDDLHRLRDELIASASKDAASGWDAYSLRALDAAIARTERGIRVGSFSHGARCSNKGNNNNNNNNNYSTKLLLIRSQIATKLVNILYCYVTCIVRCICQLFNQARAEQVVKANNEKMATLPAVVTCKSQQPSHKMSFKGQRYVILVYLYVVDS